MLNAASPETTNPEDYINQEVKDPRPNDVLCGRGGSINSHPGNGRFRQLVEKRKRVYLTARFKREKRLIASSIVSEIRELNPPGRFLQQDKASGLWKDIGDEKARDKTSQALRENAPKIRADLETKMSVQRAEIHRDEEMMNQQQLPNPAAHPPHQGYYPPPPNGWGAYPPPPHPFYGYAPPPSHHQHGAPPPSYYPPPPQHAPPPHQNSHWGYYPPAAPHAHAPPPLQPSNEPTTPSPPSPAKSSVVDYIASGAESVKQWAFGSDETASRAEQGDHQSVVSKPLSYVHEDGSKKRRMVKFSSDTKRNNKRSFQRRTSLTNSIMSGSSQEVDLEPHAMDEDIEDRSLMSSMANQIFASIGSWDTTSILCGVDNTDRDSMPFHGSRKGVDTAPRDQPMEEDEMNVEWEGQEVQLMEKNDQDSVTSEDRMPPPPRQVQHHENHSIAFSSLGSCHSWMPEQFNDAASSFFGSIRSSSQAPSSNQQHHDVPMEQQMDYSVHTENFSLGGSIGGNSLTRVFEHDVLPDGTGSLAGMSHQVISQVSSWERSYRSRSPLSVGSAEEGDDISLISKESSKMSAANSREGGISVSPVNTPRDFGSVWGTKE